MNSALKRPPSAIRTVDESWGEAAPEWVKTLAAFCDAESQAAAARLIGRSTSLINQVLKNKYMGDLTGVEERVNSAFRVVPVPCPVLGDIDGASCLAHQQATYHPGNHLAVRLYVACRRCPHNLGRKGGPSDA